MANALDHESVATLLWNHWQLVFLTWCFLSSVFSVSVVAR